jgi:hypothetical protein
MGAVAGSIRRNTETAARLRLLIFVQPVCTVSHHNRVSHEVMNGVCHNHWGCIDLTQGKVCKLCVMQDSLQAIRPQTTAQSAQTRQTSLSWHCQDAKLAKLGFCYSLKWVGSHQTHESDCITDAFPTWKHTAQISHRHRQTQLSPKQALPHSQAQTQPQTLLVSSTGN